MNQKTYRREISLRCGVPSFCVVRPPPCRGTALVVRSAVAVVAAAAAGAAVVVLHRAV